MAVDSSVSNDPITDALIALGYKPGEVTKLVGGLDTDGQSAEDIIRSALKQVAG